MVKILLVEDDPPNRTLLERMLRGHGYEVVSAGDGAKGMALARAERPALIIMDMGLPVLNGWQVTHRLKSLPATRAIPIIALTAYAAAADRERCLAIGCDDYDIKPVELDRLLGKVRACLAAAAPAG